MARKLRFEARTRTEIILRYLGGGFMAFLALLFWLAVDPRAWEAGGLRTYALVHLDVLGWITTVMLGVYLNLLPVTLPRTRVNPRLAEVAFWPYGLGVVLLILGFWTGRRELLLGGGILLPLVLLVLSLHLVWGVWPAASEMLRNPTALSYLLAPLSLGSAAILGGLMALSLGGVLSPSALTLVPFHLLFALGGWLALTVMGSAYRLVPFFFATPSPRDEASFGSLAVLLWAAGLLAGGLGWGWGRSLLLSLGALLFAWDMARMMAHGRHRKREPVQVLTQVSFLLFLGAVLLWALGRSLAASPWPWMGASLYVALFLAPSLLIFAQLSRILVFLTALDLLQRKGIRTDRQWHLSRPRPALAGGFLWVAGGLGVALGGVLPPWSPWVGAGLQLLGGLLLLGSLWPSLWARRLLRDGG